MTRVPALAAILLLAGCLGDRVRTEMVDVFDLRPYETQGFLITPTDYDGPYTALGMVRVSIYPGSKTENVGTGEYRKVEDVVSMADLVALAHKEAVALGADALVLLRVSTVSPYEHPGAYQAEGFAIKRRQP